MTTIQFEQMMEVLKDVRELLAVLALLDINRGNFAHVLENFPNVAKLFKELGLLEEEDDG